MYTVSGVARCAAHELEMEQAAARWAADHIAANPDVDFTPEYRTRALGAAKDLV